MTANTAHQNFRAFKRKAKADRDPMMKRYYASQRDRWREMAAYLEWMERQQKGKR